MALNQTSFQMGLSIESISEHTCSLGEGLFCSDSGVANWVDIDRQEVFYSGGDRVVVFESTPSAIIAHRPEGLEVVTTDGLVLLSTESGKIIQARSWQGLQHDIGSFRTNDAVSFLSGTGGLVGFMHVDTPQTVPGFVYKFDAEGNCDLLCEDIFIPNGFVPLNVNEYLVCDSAVGQIRNLDIRTSQAPFEKNPIWTTVSDGAPDGGCRVGDLVFFAIWGGACVKVFSKHGDSLGQLPLPVTYPTNIKKVAFKDEFYVTSAWEASEGQVKRELDGKTLRVCY